MDGDGASLDYLTVNKKLVAPNLAAQYDGPTTLTVGTGGDYGSLSEVFAMLNNRILPSDVTINVISDITDIATLTGVMGSGCVNINGYQ